MNMYNTPFNALNYHIGMGIILPSMLQEYDAGICITLPSMLQDLGYILG